MYVYLAYLAHSNQATKNIDLPVIRENNDEKSQYVFPAMARDHVYLTFIIKHRHIIDIHFDI